MKKVELIYDHDCPNVELARTRLLRAFAETGIPARWAEWERADPSGPSYVRAYGSPTVLVDGEDVAGDVPAQSVSSCRLYAAANGGFSGAPAAEMIATALRKVDAGPAPRGSEGKSTGWRRSLAVLPGIGTSLLPIGVCPACWPAYAGVLSSLGFGFLLETAYLLPLTAMFFATAVVALAYKAGTRRGYKPFVLGLVASATVLAGKFLLESDSAMYTGIAMLIVASLWNAWPRRNAGNGKDTCPACAPAGQRW